MRVIIDVPSVDFAPDALAIGRMVMGRTVWADWKVGWGWSETNSDGVTYWVCRTKTGISVRVTN